MHPLYKCYEYTELKSRFKTGDIILFHALDNINPIFIGTYYGHIGVIYIDPDEPNKPYLFEAFNTSTTPFYPQECSNGVALVELEHRLNSYRGYCFYKELVVPIAVDLQYGFKEFITYAVANMKYNESVITNGLNKLLFNEPLHTETNCGELAYMSLIKLGLLPRQCASENRKHHLAWLASLIEVNGNRYLDPVYVLANYFRPA